MNEEMIYTFSEGELGGSVVSTWLKRIKTNNGSTFCKVIKSEYPSGEKSYTILYSCNGSNRSEHYRAEKATESTEKRFLASLTEAQEWFNKRLELLGAEKEANNG